MKILVSRLSKEIGGAEISARDHAFVFAKLGHEVWLATNSQGLKELARQKKIYTSTLFWLHPKKLRVVVFPLLFVSNTIKALAMLLRFRPDIVNPHSRDDQILFTLLKPLFGYRVVWKDAGDMHFQLKKNRTGAIAKLYQKLYIRSMQKSDGIYFLNEKNRQEACDYVDGLTEKTRVIHSDMLFDSFTVTQKEARKNLVIGTVIRLVEDKCIDMLIDVFAGIQKTRPDTELWIVGDGEVRQKLEKQVANLELGKSVHFYGYQQDPSYYYSNFDIFVQPASYEPWGRNIKEAKYFGLPIVGSATDGISRQITVNETGLLFSPKNSDELQQELLRLVQDAELRNKLGKNARKAALDEGDFIDLIRDHVLPFLKGDE